MIVRFGHYTPPTFVTNRTSVFVRERKLCLDDNIKKSCMRFYSVTFGARTGCMGYTRCMPIYIYAISHRKHRRSLSVVDLLLNT